MKKISISLVLFALTLFGACKKTTTVDEVTDALGHELSAGCNLSASSTCYVTSATTGTAAAEATEAAWAEGCTNASGTVVESCTTAACVGNCTYTQTTSGVSSSIKYYYYSTLHTATTAEATCSAITGATWSATCN